MPSYEQVTITKKSNISAYEVNIFVKFVTKSFENAGLCQLKRLILSNDCSKRL